ncbi:manganese-binding transcriptional regulator MntR [Lacunimicrobium album]
MSEQTTSFRRTRNDHASETAEDYVEGIHDVIQRQGKCRVVDLATLFGVSHVTVTKIVSRLQKEGYVDTQPYAPITLTEDGQKLADEARQRHEIVLDFLRAIGVSEQQAALDAEGIEHHVSPETLRCMAEVTMQKNRKKV